jgi:hypothetical protein
MVLCYVKQSVEGKLVVSKGIQDRLLMSGYFGVFFDNPCLKVNFSFNIS